MVWPLRFIFLESKNNQLFYQDASFSICYVSAEGYHFIASAHFEIHQLLHVVGDFLAKLPPDYPFTPEELWLRENTHLRDMAYISKYTPELPLLVHVQSRTWIQFLDQAALTAFDGAPHTPYAHLCRYFFPNLVQYIWLDKQELRKILVESKWAFIAAFCFCMLAFFRWYYEWNLAPWFIMGTSFAAGFFAYRAIFVSQLSFPNYLVRVGTSALLVMLWAYYFPTLVFLGPALTTLFWIGMRLIYRPLVSGYIKPYESWYWEKQHSLYRKYMKRS